jgi:hypothetical protein
MSIGRADALAEELNFQHRRRVNNKMTSAPMRGAGSAPMPTLNAFLRRAPSTTQA